MPSPSSFNRIQPCLLDRLTDNYRGRRSRHSNKNVIFVAYGDKTSAVREFCEVLTTELRLSHRIRAICLPSDHFVSNSQEVNYADWRRINVDDEAFVADALVIGQISHGESCCIESTVHDVNRQEELSRRTSQDGDIASLAAHVSRHIHSALFREHAMTTNEYRDAVLRDLHWLLNTIHLEQSVDLSDWPHSRDSVINFGWPSLTGQWVGTGDSPLLISRLRRAILLFEPRFDANSLRVRFAVDSSSDGNVAFEIEGDLIAEPMPLHVYLRTDFEFGTTNVSLTDLATSD